MSEFSGEIRYSDPPQSRNEELLKAIIEGTQYTDPPQSRNESILKSIIDNTPYDELPQSRIEDLLLRLKEAIVENIPESVKALPTVDTASGAIATFNTDLTENLVSVKCQIVAKQASGTPSPDNPLPITTYTSLNLSHSGSDTSNPNVTNIPFGQTVANGVLDITTGKLTITMSQPIDLGDYTWINEGNGQARVSTIQSSYLFIGDVICDSYQGINSITLTDNTIAVTNSQLYPIIRVKDTVNIPASASASDIKTFMTGKKACFELATPIEIQLDSITLQALLNENNIWCDTGDTEVKFLLTVGKKISGANTRSIASIPVEKSEDELTDELTEKSIDELTEKFTDDFTNELKKAVEENEKEEEKGEK